MQISFSTLRANFNRSVGYGYAAHHIVESLNKLGHTVPYQYAKAPVQLNFSQPTHFKLHKNQYQIGYTPWESTQIPSDWKEKFLLCDEVWATSDWNAEWFKECGINKPIHVYPHGIDEIWKPYKRIIEDGRPLKFLHIGEPAPRKAGQMVVDAFGTLFGNNPNYSLTIKAHHTNTTRVFNNYLDKEIIGLPHTYYNNVKVITDDLTEDELVKLYYDHDVMVYPSYGEGFGFIPFQALATGMPTICTSGWAHYQKFLGPLALKSNLVKSEFMNLPGLVFEPNYQHLLETMRDVVIDFKAYSGFYFAQSTKIHDEYNWLQLTNNAFDHIFKKFH